MSGLIAAGVCFAVTHVYAGAACVKLTVLSAMCFAVAGHVAARK
jgi:hypothetical protein